MRQGCEEIQVNEELGGKARLCCGDAIVSPLSLASEPLVLEFVMQPRGSLGLERLLGRFTRRRRGIFLLERNRIETLFLKPYTLDGQLSGGQFRCFTKIGKDSQVRRTGVPYYISV